MNPSEMLKQLIATMPDQISTGVVSHVEGRSVYVMDGGRLRVVTSLPGDASLYAPGDAVRLEGGTLVGRSAPRRSKYIYL